MGKHKTGLNIDPNRRIERLKHAMIPPRLYEVLFRTACEWALNGDRDAAQWVIDELTVMNIEATHREYESLRLNTNIRAEIIGKPCVVCGKPADTVDHKIPVSKGGTNDKENLQPMCWDCNRRKGNRE